MPAFVRNEKGMLRQMGDKIRKGLQTCDEERMQTNERDTDRV